MQTDIFILQRSRNRVIVKRHHFGVFFYEQKINIRVITFQNNIHNKIYFIKVDSFVDTFEFLKKIEQIENPHKPNVYADYFV